MNYSHVQRTAHVKKFTVGEGKGSLLPRSKIPKTGKRPRWSPCLVFIENDGSKGVYPWLFPGVPASQTPAFRPSSLLNRLKTVSFSVVARALLQHYKMADMTAFLGLKIWFSEVETVLRPQIRDRSFTPCALK